MYSLESKRSLSIRLSAGLMFSLLALAVYAGYTAAQMKILRGLQTEIIDRNRRDSLLLVRVQNDLNMLGLGMRDMLDAQGNYPLTAWRSQFARTRTDLEDAVAAEAQVAPPGRTPEQSRYLASSLSQFWNALDRVFELAEHDEAAARGQIRLSLQARQAALATAVSRLLVQNNESEELAVARTRQIHGQVERNLYIFLGAMLLAIGGVSVYLVRYNRRVFDRLTTLSQRRSELAQQLISMQENTFRSISRELHDEFGQILTAVGALLKRAHTSREDLREVSEIVQGALDKVRSLSQALHPVMLDEAGLEGALDTYIPVFERRTGIAVQYTKTGVPRAIERTPSIHLYRVLQEALNNVARHSGSKEAEVRFTMAADSVTLEVEDHGRGFGARSRDGLGLISMRERAQIVGGQIDFLEGAHGGALVRFHVPLAPEEAHVPLVH